MNTSSKPFNFNEWKKLSETNPEAFETRRRHVIEKVIESAPEHQRRRLRGLQWQIDVIRERYRNPLVSSAKLFEMMWQKVYGENGFLEALTSTAGPKSVPVQNEAKIIRLHRLPKNHPKHP